MANDYSITKENIFNIEFENFCRESLYAKIYKLEKIRKFYVLFFKSLLVLLIILIVYSFFVKNLLIGAASFILFLAVSFYFITDTKIKNKIIRAVLSYIGNFKLANRKEKDKEFTNTIDLELFNYGRDICVYTSLFDSIIGTYKNKETVIERIEFDKTDSGEEQDIYFKGIMVKVPCSKTFSGKTIIKNKAYYIDIEKEKIDIDNEDFASLFDVYSDTPSELNFLINDNFINLITELGKENIISVSFENGNIYAAFSKNTAAAGLGCKFSSSGDFENYKKFLYTVVLLLKITDSINNT